MYVVACQSPGRGFFIFASEYHPQNTCPALGLATSFTRLPGTYSPPPSTEPRPLHETSSASLWRR